MKVLVTGITGFLGSHLAKALLGRGDAVLGVKRRGSNVSRLQDCVGSLTLFDVEDGLSGLFKLHSNIDAIVHLATSYRGDSSELVEANVLLPLKILEQMHDGCMFINTDTYFSKIPNDYSHLGNYIYSKEVALHLGKGYAAQYGVNFVNVRLEHVYGPEDGPEKFTSVLFSRLFENEKEIELTKGEQERDFIYVDDVVSAYITIMNASSVRNACSIHNFDIGTGKVLSLKGFVLKARQSFEADSELVFGALPYREGELMRSVANVEPLKSLGWLPRVSLGEGMARVVESRNKA